MSTNADVVVRGPGEGRMLLVGGADYVTYRASGAETDGAYFCFEVATTPGFGPPMHAHAYRELFYVLEGKYEFTIGHGEGVDTIMAGPGTSVAVAPDVPYRCKNATDQPARLLCFDEEASLEGFFEDFGVPVSSTGDAPEGAEPPDFGAMAAALERTGVRVLAP